MNFDSHCANRLKSERKRLGLSQASIAELCGISREMWGKYERGVATPGGDTLLAFALHGGNVQYVLTGQDSFHSSNEVAVESEEEKKLLENYRAMDEAAKLNIQAVGDAFAQSSSLDKKDAG